MVESSARLRRLQRQRERGFNQRHVVQTSSSSENLEAKLTAAYDRLLHQDTKIDTPSPRPLLSKPTPPSPPSPVRSPKSEAVSKSIAEARRFGRKTTGLDERNNDKLPPLTPPSSTYSTPKRGAIVTITTNSPSIIESPGGGIGIELSIGQEERGNNKCVRIPMKPPNDNYYSPKTSSRKVMEKEMKSNDVVRLSLKSPNYGSPRSSRKITEKQMTSNDPVSSSSPIDDVTVGGIKLTTRKSSGSALFSSSQQTSAPSYQKKSRPSSIHSSNLTTTSSPSSAKPIATVTPSKETDAKKPTATALPSKAADMDKQKTTAVSSKVTSTTAKPKVPPPPQHKKDDKSGSPPPWLRKTADTLTNPSKINGTHTANAANDDDSSTNIVEEEEYSADDFCSVSDNGTGKKSRDESTIDLTSAHNRLSAYRLTKKNVAGGDNFQQQHSSVQMSNDANKNTVNTPPWVRKTAHQQFNNRMTPQWLKRESNKPVHVRSSNIADISSDISDEEFSPDDFSTNGDIGHLTEESNDLTAAQQSRNMSVYRAEATAHSIGFQSETSFASNSPPPVPFDEAISRNFISEGTNSILNPSQSVRKIADEQISASNVIVSLPIKDFGHTNPSKFTSFLNPTANVQKERVIPQTKPKVLSRPMDNVGNFAKKIDNRSVSMRHGGTPVWINTSILSENEGSHGSAWCWVRGYLHVSNETDDSVSVTVDDPDTSTNLNGHKYTIPKKYNDGTHILMDNPWWSTTHSSTVGPSPTSISQSIHTGFTDSGIGGMPPGDLIDLTHLHEPAIVHALRVRYSKDIIYTNTGAILLALNPFKHLDHLYTRDMMEVYWNDRLGQGGEMEERESMQPPPHAFAVAERAYSNMMRSLKDRDNMLSTGVSSIFNQSILVSGESGAGKTVTTKIVMRYISLLSQRHSGRAKSDRDCPSVETQVLQSNPILESFGNARTIRNDNSSRFGKFIEMSFQARKQGRSGERGSLLGATIDFYLLEKVRLVSVNPGERNYHVFYEILSPGMSLSDKKRFMLTSNFGQGRTPLTVHDFSMTSVSGTFDRRDCVDDSDTFGELQTAMDTVGFSQDEQDGIYSITAALLHFSNIRFVNGSNDDCLVYDKDGTIRAVSTLLGLSEESLKMALTASLLEAKGEQLMKRLSSSQAQKALEATVKATYGALFSYIVARINKSIEVQGISEINERMNEVVTVGVLDIFGFESFDKNSFEQLCINYCNEALQQQFNRFVFKAEQAEYVHEGIHWSNIQFPDNQEGLDLIEKKNNGIFSVLDEQCRLPKRTDQTFAKAVYDACENNSFFAASQIQKSKGRFSIVHYAGKVEYECESFILKNKDELPKSVSHLLASSSKPLVSRLALIIIDAEASPKDDDRSPMKRTTRTVSGQFSSQLKDLRSRIAATEPHYIRCLKPNDRLLSNQFDAFLVAHQLNCAGVLPAMRIARAGFAMRYPHISFIQRYQPIVGNGVRLGLESHQCTCQFLVSSLSSRLDSTMRQQTQNESITDLLSWGVQVGKSKVFLRTAAFDALEKLRDSTFNNAAVIIQARTRSFLCQNTFYLILGSILTLQCASRKFVSCLYVRRLRINNTAAVTIQKQWRSYGAWSNFQNVLYIATWCQRCWRGGIRDKSFEGMSHIKQKMEQEILTGQNRTSTFDSQSWITARSTLTVSEQPTQEDTILNLSQEIAKKNQELRTLRQMVDSMRLSTLPSIVTVNESSPLNMPVHFTSTDFDASTNYGFHANSLSMLDLDDVPPMEYSQTSYPGSTIDNTDEFTYSTPIQTTDSSFFDSVISEQLPFHQAVLDDDKDMLLDEIRNSSCIELGINSADSRGRYVHRTYCRIILMVYTVNLHSSLTTLDTQNATARCSPVLQS